MNVLLVEDEALVAMLIEDVLIELGHFVVAVGGRLGQALELAGEAKVDFAVVDLNLNGERTYLIAETLARRGIPFIFATGYGAAGVEPRWSRVPVLQKPFEPDELARAIDAALH